MIRFVKWAAIGLVLMLGGLFLLYQQDRIGFLIQINNALNPIGPYQTVSWEQGGSDAPSRNARSAPNIIVILADDLGHNDVSTFGGGIANGLVKTPNIDSIAHNGAVLENGYVAHATCAPSRAALLTGRAPRRLGFEYNATPPLLQRLAFAELSKDPRLKNSPAHLYYHKENEKAAPPMEKMGLDPGEVILPSLLRQAGYHTMMIGKWHLGGAPNLRPNARGFDESISFLEGAARYADPKTPGIVNAKLDYDPTDKYIWEGTRFAVRRNDGKLFRPKTYLTDYFGDEAKAAIMANRNRPFFLYLAFNAPHTPLQATQADYDAFPQIEDHGLRVYAAMVHALDRNVGKVLATLKEQGLADNTLLFFLSDNGGASVVGFDDINKPYRGWKQTFFEGGVHIPYFVQWPAKIPAGQTITGRTSSLDIFTTSLQAAGAPVPTDRPIDGLSLLPRLDGSQTPLPTRDLYWRSGEYYSLITQDGWKLQYSQRLDKSWLFDLNADPLERHNLAATELERIARMRARMKELDKDARKPLWPLLIEQPVRVDHTVKDKTAPGQEYLYWVE